jgi:hypothetical protein
VASVTIDNLNPETLGRLHSEARRRGIDVEVLIEEMILDRLDAMAKPGDSPTYHDLDALAGTWSADDAAEFLAAIADMNTK